MVRYKVKNYILYTLSYAKTPTYGRLLAESHEGNLENLLINSIYKATEGEGVHIGTPQIFVRFQGCRVGCLNCDSMDTWSFDEGEFWHLDSVLEEIKKFDLKRVSITGGDPLHPKNLDGVISLAKALKQRGYYVNIEASGTRVVDELFDLIDFISFDYKTPSTGVKTSMALIERLVAQYQGKYQIKSVIESHDDFIDCLEKKKTLDPQVPWILTPAYNFAEEFPEKRFQDILNWNELANAPFRVIGQQHKWVFGPKKKRV